MMTESGWAGVTTTLLQLTPLVTQPLFPECEWFCDITAGLSVGEAFSAGSESRHSGQGRREARPSAPAAHRDTAAGAGGLEAHG